MATNSNGNGKRVAVLSIRVPVGIKQRLMEIARRNEEYPSTIGRKCLTCFVKGKSCEVSKRYALAEEE